MAAQWEYAVETLGGALRGAQPAELADLLNHAALDGWEPMHVLLRTGNSNQLMVVLRRKVQSRSRGRTRSWS